MTFDKSQPHCFFETVDFANDGNDEARALLETECYLAKHIGSFTCLECDICDRAFKVSDDGEIFLQSGGSDDCLLDEEPIGRQYEAVIKPILIS